ncbi:LOW QUALITY PROTEIN: disintegrin and metalloproteinase domain-containing protein 29-like [Ctenodactylus gundi]
MTTTIANATRATCISDGRFTPGSSYDCRLRCSNCTYSPMGTSCRPIQNICELPEYRLGTIFTCPVNMYMQDGTPCTQEGYCYQGNCTDRTTHCQEIFGANAHNGDDECKINTKIFRFGHCSRSNPWYVTYVVCRANDMKCGRLQCANVTQLPKLQDHVSFHQSLYGNSWCFGLDEHCGTGTLDVGRVRSGSLCAPKKFCSRGSCSGLMADLNYDCKPEKCNFRGVCNNNRNCHCHMGWEPPTCINRGAGGSTDSGSPPRRVRTTHKVTVPQQEAQQAYVSLPTPAKLRLQMSVSEVAKTVKPKETWIPQCTELLRLLSSCWTLRLSRSQMATVISPASDPVSLPHKSPCMNTQNDSVPNGEPSPWQLA